MHVDNEMSVNGWSNAIELLSICHATRDVCWTEWHGNNCPPAFSL